MSKSPADRNRVFLRDFAAFDADAMEAVFCDADVMRFSERGPRDRSFVRTWIGARIADTRTASDFRTWAVVENATGAVAGYAGLTRSEGRCGPAEAELGFRLARRFWGRGYATEAAALVLDRLTGPEVERVIAIIDPANAASIRVVEKLDMHFERTVMLPGYDYPDHVYTKRLRPVC